MALRKITKQKIKRLLFVLTVSTLLMLMFVYKSFLSEHTQYGFDVFGFQKKYSYGYRHAYNMSPEETSIISKNCPELLTLSDESRKTNFSKPTCQIYSTTRKHCVLAKKMHPVNQRLSRCTNNNTKIICEYKWTKVSCHNEDLCPNVAVSVGSMDPRYGYFPNTDKWPRFDNKRELEINIQYIAEESIRNGFNFIFLHCHPKDSPSVDQLLMLTDQSYLINDTERSNRRESSNQTININILVLDSLSRYHFFRMLPNSVSELSRIKNNHSNHVEVLDFEMVQSAAPYTIHNIGALMSGKIHQQNPKVSYKFQNFSQLFKKKGYYTLFQEDSCWYDHWGTIFNAARRKKTLGKNKRSYQKAWKKHQMQLRDFHIDDYGLFHVTCEIFKRYGGRSNQYGDKTPSVCFNRMALSSYFLKYVQETFASPKRRKTQRIRKIHEPFLSYTHINAAHEQSGMRIQDSDEGIANFLFDFSKLENTWTLVLSDHGAKSTSYSRTKQGRLETYHPFLFMLIPKKVRQILGENRVKALKENQKRLMTFVDLHYALMDLVQPSNDHSKNEVSLFTPISPNRKCSDIPLVSYALCICKGTKGEYPDNSKKFKHVANFAISHLNGLIDEQFSWSKTKTSRKCSKLYLATFTDIRQKRLRQGDFVTIMYVNVKSRKPILETFEVQVKHSKKKNGQVFKLDLWRRISIYQGFEQCRDKTVDVKLCIC